MILNILTSGEGGRGGPTAVRAIADAVGASLGVERHREPDLALAVGCGRALRQHHSRPVRECDGAVGGSLQPQMAAFLVSSSGSKNGDVQKEFLLGPCASTCLQQQSPYHALGT